MDDNAFEAIQISVFGLMFVMALSVAVVSYNKLSDAAKVFVANNSVSRRSEVTNENMSLSEVDREVGKAELIMSVLNLDSSYSYATTDDYTVVIKNAGTFKYEPDAELENGEKIGVINYNNGSNYYTLNKTYDDEKMADKLHTVAGADALVKLLEKSIGDDLYTISYNNNTITYTKK